VAKKGIFSNNLEVSLDVSTDFKFNESELIVDSSSNIFSGTSLISKPLISSSMSLFIPLNKSAGSDTPLKGQNQELKNLDAII
jgi:hypothetical protein